MGILTHIRQRMGRSHTWNWPEMLRRTLPPTPPKLTAQFERNGVPVGRVVRTTHALGSAGVGADTGSRQMAESSHTTGNTPTTHKERPAAVSETEQRTALQQATDALQIARDQVSWAYVKNGNHEGSQAMDYIRAKEKIILGIKELFSDAAYTAEQGAKLLKELCDAMEYSPSAKDKSHLIGGMSYVLERIPVDKLQKMYFSAAPQENGSLRYVLKRLASNEHPYIKAAAPRELARMYGMDVQGIFRRGQELNDPLVTKIVEDNTFDSVAIYAMSERTPGTSSAEYTLQVRDYTEKFLRHLGMPEQLNRAYRRAMNERTMKKNSEGFTIRGEGGGVDLETVQIELMRLSELFKSVGPDVINRVWKECGITNFDYYTKEQIERMDAFVRGNPELLEHLRAGDVTVVVADAMGDHNGAGKKLAERFEPPSGRLLPFEITQPRDFAHVMFLLRKHGIQPSTVVNFAHGSPGRMHYGSGNNEFYLSIADKSEIKQSQTASSIPAYSLRWNDLLVKGVTEIMQPSRGIDDDASAIGRKKVILVSCKQAAHRFVTPYVNGIPQEYRFVESTASTIAQTVSDETVDVYASSENTNVDRTSVGYKYIKSPAWRHTYREGTRPIVSRVEEVVLRPSSEVSLEKAA